MEPQATAMRWSRMAVPPALTAVKRQMAIWEYLAAGVVGGMAAAMDPETAGAPLALAGVGAVVGLGLNYSAAGNEKRAGIALQR